MRNSSRPAIISAVVGLLAFGGSRALVGQQETGAVPSDTGVVANQGDTAGRADSGHKVVKRGAKGYRYQGARSDTSLSAKPSTQTGPSRRDSNQASKFDTMSAPRGQVEKKGAGNYRYDGAPSDTALRAKPGTQTGRVNDSLGVWRDTSGGVETGEMGPADSSSYSPPDTASMYAPPRSDSGTYAPPDSTMYAPPRSDSGTYAPPDSATYAPPDHLGRERQ